MPSSPIFPDLQYYKTMNTLIKTFFVFFLLLISFVFSQQAYAEESGKTIEVIVTEKMPGIDCEPFTEVNRWNTNAATQWWAAWPDQVVQQQRSAGTVATKYKCFVPVGMKWAFLLVWAIIRWITVFAMLCAVLFLVFCGIRLTTWWIDTEAKGKVKGQIIMTLGGIVLLLLSGPFLRLIAPWIYV